MLLANWLSVHMNANMLMLTQEKTELNIFEPKYQLKVSDKDCPCSMSREDNGRVFGFIFDHGLSNACYYPIHILSYIEQSISRDVTGTCFDDCSPNVCRK